jgi:hypothetical protein
MFRSVLPEILKPLRTQFRIAHGVRDVLVPKVLLDRAGVLTFAGELEATGMPQHVRMDIGRLGVFGAQLPQGSQLGADQL